MPEPIRIAIVGGGIAGCTLANGLSRYESIVYDVFEGKPSFRERGAGVAIAPNAQKALRAMGMDAEVLLHEAGGMKMGPTYCIVGTGVHKGQPILELPAGVYVVDRSQWLELLLQKLPEEHLHANKKLVSISQHAGTEEPYRLEFEDGSTHEADAVIGCDGGRSKVRQLVLGPEHEASWALKFGGYWDARGRTTPQKAADYFGKQLFDPTAANEVALVGNGAFLLFAPIGEGKVYHVIISAVAGPEYDQGAWKVPLTRDFLEQHCRDWDDGFPRGVIDSLLAEDFGSGVAFSQWESPEALTYFRDRMCIMGDAGRSTTPWMGQGACMSIEDAAVLSALLGSVADRRELEFTFQGFDHMRRGRPEFQVRHSQEAAKILTGQVSLDPAAVRHRAAEKCWTDTWAIDMDAHIKDALKLLRIRGPPKTS